MAWAGPSSPAGVVTADVTGAVFTALVVAADDAVELRRPVARCDNQTVVTLLIGASWCLPSSLPWPFSLSRSAC